MIKLQKASDTEQPRRYFWDKAHMHKIVCPSCNIEYDYECTEQFPRLEFREWIRANTSNYNLVVEDFDLITRVYDTKGRDAKGSFKLLELKLRGTWLKEGQKWTFGLINEHLQKVPEEERHRYEGFYLIEVSTYNWISEPVQWWINNKSVTKEELISFIEGDKIERISPLGKNSFGVWAK